MAKRKRKSAHHQNHRRRKHHRGMNGISMNTLMPTLVQVGEGIAGAIAASYLLSDKSPLANFMADNPKIKPMILMGAGVAGALLVKNNHVKAVSLGVASYSGLQLAKDVIPGIGDLMIGDIEGMMGSLMIGSPTTEMLVLQDNTMEENVIEDLVIADEVYQ